MLTTERWWPSVADFRFAEFDRIADQVNALFPCRWMRHGNFHVTRGNLIRGKNILNIMNGAARDIGRIKCRDERITLPFADFGTQQEISWSRFFSRIWLVW